MCYLKLKLGLQLCVCRLHQLLAAWLMIIVLVPPLEAQMHAQSDASKSPVFASAELMSRYLAAEINAYRGRLDEALIDYQVVAKATRDPVLARRATRIAMHLSSPAAVSLAELWIEVSDGAFEAQQALLLLHLKAQDQQRAVATAEALIQSAAVAGKDGYLEVAAVAAISHDVDQAVLLLETILQQHQQNADAYYAMGVALFGMKRYEQAQSSLRQAIDMNPDDARYWLLLSRLLSVQGDAEKAAEVLSRAASQHPRDALLQLAYAGSLIANQQYAEALVLYRQMLEAQPRNSELLQTAGVIALELAQWSEARAYLERLLDDPEMRNQARLLLGKVELESGNLDAASEYFNGVDGALQAEAILQLAKIEIAAGRLEAGHKLFAQQRLSDPDKAAAYYLAEAELLQAADYNEDAQLLLLKAIETHPDDLDLRYAHGMLAIAQGDLVTLEKRMREVIGQQPDNALALNALGYTLADQTDRFSEALELVSKAFQLMPESAAVLDSMGWVMFRLGRYDEAIGYLEQAAEKDDDGEISAHLGEVLWHSGQRDEAVRVWREGLKREPDNRHIAEVMKRLLP